MLQEVQQEIKWVLSSTYFVECEGVLGTCLSQNCQPLKYMLSCGLLTGNGMPNTFAIAVYSWGVGLATPVQTTVVSYQVRIKYTGLQVRTVRDVLFGLSDRGGDLGIRQAYIRTILASTFSSNAGVDKPVRSLAA